jgi:hypothetical protein
MVQNLPPDVIKILIERTGAGEYDPLGGQRCWDEEHTALGALVHVANRLEGRPHFLRKTSNVGRDNDDGVVVGRLKVAAKVNGGSHGSSD